MRDQALSTLVGVLDNLNVPDIDRPYRTRQRCQGYAARVVASLSQAQLDAGKKTCNLHADLTNPTSNGVYRRIGHTMVARSFRIRLIDSQSTPRKMSDTQTRADTNQGRRLISNPKPAQR